jgi:acetolactate synthase regulatory subunit
MLIVMKSDATDSQVEAVLRVIEQLGFRGHPMPGATRTAIGVTALLIPHTLRTSRALPKPFASVNPTN